MIFWYCIIKTILHKSGERRFGHVEREGHFALMIIIDNTKNDTKMPFQWHFFLPKAANWCLRFRYLASLATSLDVTLLDIIQDKNKSLINIRNATNTSKTDPDWYYVEVNIIGENDFKVCIPISTWFIQTFFYWTSVWTPLETLSHCLKY